MIVRTAGDPEAVIAVDQVLHAEASHWAVREVTGLIRRTLKKAGVDRWNKRVLEAHGMSERITRPSRRFNRKVGVYAGRHSDPFGNLLTTEEWQRKQYEWLPSAADKAFLHSRQVTPVYKPGQFANYIAPPQRGINRQPLDFEYVRTEA